MDTSRLRRAGLAALAAAAFAIPAAAAPQPVSPTVPRCLPDGGPVVVSGVASPDDARTYRVLPFEVVPGTQRVEVGYRWRDLSAAPSNPVTQTVFDLGLWDEDGYRAFDGFRGWSGSRLGRLHDGQAPVFVQADGAARGYRPGKVRAGIWHAELGIAAVGPQGAEWTVEVRCRRLEEPGATPKPDPVDATHVAREEPGWYHGDFHLHAYHSHERGPAGEEMVRHARAAGLEIVPVTEYVTDQHWYELGAVQRAHPDLLIWPGREIITYFGHAVTLGETPSVVDYRHGFEDVRLGGIQRLAKADGALFGVAHPTTFPGPLFRNFCRGCEFELGEDIDWDLVDSMEVLTGPVIVSPRDLGAPVDQPRGENPFMGEAIRLWERQLLAGHRITAVSGSDDKLGPGYGSSATAVYAPRLSREAVAEALRAGHAYIRTRGVHDSPALELQARTPDGRHGIFGDTLPADTAEVTVTVRAAKGQTLRLSRNGAPAGVVPIPSEEFTFVFTAFRTADEGPLGTFWRVDTADAQSLTTIGNPIFLTSAN